MIYFANFLTVCVMYAGFFLLFVMNFMLDKFYCCLFGFSVITMTVVAMLLADGDSLNYMAQNSIYFVYAVVVYN